MYVLGHEVRCLGDSGQSRSLGSLHNPGPGRDAARPSVVVVPHKGCREESSQAPIVTHSESGSGMGVGCH